MTPRSSIPVYVKKRESKRIRGYLARPNYPALRVLLACPFPECEQAGASPATPSTAGWGKDLPSPKETKVIGPHLPAAA